MKDHFIRMFEYDRYSNELIRELMATAGNPQKPVQLMAHLLAAQQVWINRCKALPPFAGGIWPDGHPGIFAPLIAANGAGWIAYLNGLQPDDFNRIIDYKNSKDEAFSDKLSDILAHVINHGTHHRAQIGQHLLSAGVEGLPFTDYIFYTRTR